MPKKTPPPDLPGRELVVDTYRKNAGWIAQPDICVRIKHWPTGLEASCCTDRSIHKNRAEAYKELCRLVHMNKVVANSPYSVTKAATRIKMLQEAKQAIKNGQCSAVCIALRIVVTRHDSDVVEEMIREISFALCGFTYVVDWVRSEIGLSAYRKQTRTKVFEKERFYRLRWIDHMIKNIRQGKTMLG